MEAGDPPDVCRVYSGARVVLGNGFTLEDVPGVGFQEPLLYIQYSVHVYTLRMR